MFYNIDELKHKMNIEEFLNLSSDGAAADLLYLLSKQSTQEARINVITSFLRETCWAAEAWGKIQAQSAVTNVVEQLFDKEIWT